MIEDIENAFHRLDAQLLTLTEQSLDVPRVRILRALAARPFGFGLDPAAELAAAHPVDPIDVSLHAAARTLIADGAVAACEPFARHMASFPDDAVALLFYLMVHVVSAVPGARERAEQYLRAHVDPGDWRTGPQLGMALQDAGEYDAARRIAERALADEPAAAHAVHVLAHVHYETGEHTAGKQWLDAWNAGHRIVLYGSHFVWHTALHALGEGDVSDALARYQAGVSPAAIVDAGPLLWRCAMYGQPQLDWAREAVDAAEPVVQNLPGPFPVFNACFALAAAADADRLTALARRLEDDPRPGYQDLAAQVAYALAALVDGDPSTAVLLLDNVLPQLRRIGGSNAQREVAEDTLIDALLRRGDLPRARKLLEQRLDRREHVIDRRQLRTVTR